MKVTRRAVSPPFSARPPAGSVIYAIGDIHGRADLCDRLHQAIREDAAARTSARRVVVYLGDYLGRGPEARRVIDTLLENPLPGFESIYLRGNHEDQFLRMLDGDVESGRHQLTYGGQQTLASYGISSPQDAGISAREVEALRQRDIAAGWGDLASGVSDREIEELQQEMARRLPPDHVDFLRALRVSHREGDYLFVHAGIRPGTPVAEQAPRDMIWIRKRFLESDDDFGVVVVHGHTVSEEPVVRHNRIGIDTGAYATGRLTAVVLEGDTCTLLQASAG
jgi:serine/threonine protein phosphatase 1